MSGITSSNLPVICGAGAITCTRNARKRAIQHRYRYAATATHPSNYQGCRYAKEDMRKRKSHRAPKITKGRMFSSSNTTPGLSSSAVPRSNTQQQQQPQSPPVAQTCPPPLRHNQRQVPSQFTLLLQTIRL
jgi:hypothetical protein